MNPILLYLVLLKATLTSFSGLTSLPMIRHDFVEQSHLLTDRELNNAVAVARVTPGPNGLYVVCIGYYAAGVTGAVAGLLALMTPAFVIIPLLRFVGRKAENSSVRGAIRGVTIAAAGLIVSTTIPMASDAIGSSFGAGVALVSFALLTFTKLDTAWVILAAATAGLVRASIL